MMNEHLYAILIGQGVRSEDSGTAGSKYDELLGTALLQGSIILDDNGRQGSSLRLCMQASDP